MLIVVDLKYIRKFVENNLGISLTRNTREREYVEARALYFKLCRDFTSKSWVDMAKSLGKNHATAIHAVNNVYDVAEMHNKKLKYLYDVFERSSATYSENKTSEEKDMYTENIDLRSKIMALSLEIQQMKDSMKKEYSLLDGLDDDERQLVIDKAMVFKKVIQSQRHMKV